MIKLAQENELNVSLTVPVYVYGYSRNVIGILWASAVRTASGTESDVESGTDTVNSKVLSQLTNRCNMGREYGAT